MKRYLSPFVVALMSFVLLIDANVFAAPTTAPTTAPSEKRVLVISIDGLRPDLLLRADSPNLHRLLTEGCFTMWAQTTAVAVTIPSHVSMLTGARPQIHQIEWNHDIPLAHPIYPAVPTLFEMVHKAGYTTGMVAGKSKFDVFEKPGTLDYCWVPDVEVVSDQEVLSHALPMIEQSAPQVLFIHLPENDKVGHAIGWGSPQQMAAIHGADACIGKILDVLDQKHLLDKTLVIISADHGGAGRSHGADDVRSRNIPWIAIGPGVRHGIDLTTVAADRTIHTEDTFSTACDFLGIPVDPALDGKPVMEIYNRTGQELISDSHANKPAAFAKEPVATADDKITHPHAAMQTAATGNTIDSPAVWVHPTDAGQSLIIGADASAGLCTYDLAGKLLQSVSTDSHPSSVSMLYSFVLNQKATDLAVATTHSAGSVGVKIFAIDSATRQLTDVTDNGIIPAFGGGDAANCCVYQNPHTGSAYYFITNTKGQIEQYELHPADEGKVAATRVRHFNVDSAISGCVCDIETAKLYVAEESAGIWKFSAEPDATTKGKLVAKIGDHGLTDVKGLTLYYGPAGAGYLVASNPSDNTSKIYDRAKGNAFVLTVDPVGDQKINDISQTDGISAASCPIGSDFPSGVFIAQDGQTPDGQKNFKLFDWREVAGDQLKITTGPSPRDLGHDTTAAK